MTELQKLISKKRKQLEKDISIATLLVEETTAQLRHLQQNVCKHEDKENWIYHSCQYESWTECNLCGGEVK